MKENKLEEELFCTNFELRNLSDLLVYGKAERWIYGFMLKKYEDEHLNRYKYALDFTKSKNVLDIACGCGYGSYLLATEGEANFVCGVDLSKDAIRYGNHRYFHPKVERTADDAVLYKNEKCFDVIVSFETIEHIPNYIEFIDNLYENLSEDGTVLISTPITKKTTTKPNNPFHVIEWNFFDFQKLFETKFDIIEIILQETRIEGKGNRSEYTIKNRILNRISPEKKSIIIGKDIEKFNNQYDMNFCIEGYQVLVLKKKRHLV